MNRLKEFREKAGLTQTELGFRTRIAPSFISKFESGYQIPWPKAKLKLAIALNADIDQIFPPVIEEFNRY